MELLQLKSYASSPRADLDGAGHLQTAPPASWLEEVPTLALGEALQHLRSSAHEARIVAIFSPSHQFLT